MTQSPISRDIVLDIRLPTAKPTHRVQTRLIRIPPGHPAGAHVHNGPVFGNIVSGSVVYQITDEPETVLTEGDVFYEPEGVRIQRFDAREDGVTFLAYFLLGQDEDAELTLVD